MYQDHKIVCVIPARGGSKGLPGKNIKELNGKALIAYSIEQARCSKYIDRVIVSTEDRKIADVSIKAGADVPFMRPEELAGDNVATIDVLLHAVEWLEEVDGYDFDILVLLHANTPLRAVSDIETCIELLVAEHPDNVFSVTECHRNPYFNMVEVSGNGDVSLVKEGDYRSRQAAPLVYDLNSSIYVWWKEVLKKKKKVIMEKSRVFVMPKERSIDIDDYFDFRVAEMVMTDSMSKTTSRGDG
jgi:CMP-N-acetylneuraminic acid synthetase